MKIWQKIRAANDRAIRGLVTDCIETITSIDKVEAGTTIDEVVAAHAEDAVIAISTFQPVGGAIAGDGVITTTTDRVLDDGAIGNRDVVEADVIDS